MPPLILPKSCPAANGLLTTDVLYAVQTYDRDGKEILVLITASGPIAIPSTEANKNYLKSLGIAIYSLSLPPAAPPGAAGGPKI